MKNNFITKIIGATLAFAMMIGGAVGINAAKQAKEVNADDAVGTINFGPGDGCTTINGASITGDDSLGNEWTITTAGTTSFTNNSGQAYSQVGSSKKPATSITFTTTLPGEQTITAFSAKFGGFSGTAGTVALKVGAATVGTGSLNADNDVTVSNSSQGTGTALTVTVTNIAKGVKAYFISYTYSTGGGEQPANTVQSVSINNAPQSSVTGVTVGSEGPLLSASATMRDGDDDGIAFTWASDNEDAVKVAANGRLTYVGNGTAHISATASFPSGSEEGDTNVGTVTIETSNLKGASSNNPLNVSEALALAEATGATATTYNCYTSGIISRVGSDAFNSNYGNKTFWISANGTTNTELEVFRSLYLNNQKMTESQFNSVEAGDTVIVVGKLINYNSQTKEYQDCYLAAHNKPALPRVSITENSQSIDAGSTLTLHATVENPVENYSLSWVSGDENVLTVASSGELTATVTAGNSSGSTTVLVRMLDENSQVVTTSASITITVVAPIVSDGDTFIIYYGTSGNEEYFTGVSDNIGTHSTTKAEAAIVTAIEGETDGQFALKVNGKYLEYHGTGNNIYVSDTNNSDATLWAISSNGSYVVIESVNVSGRRIRYNTNSPRFCCYANDANINIEQVVAPEVDEVTVMGDSSANANGAVSVVKDFLYEVSYVDPLHTGNSSVSVSVVNSSDTADGAEVTTAPSNGSFSVTFTASDTYTVTVTSLEDDTKSDSMTITVSNIYVPPVPVSHDYELYENDLVEGDYILYYGGGAMKNSIESDRAQFEEATPVADTISTDDSSIIWHIAPASEEGFFTIYNAEAGKFLASTGAKSKAQLLADGTDDKALWSVARDNDAFDFTNKYNAANDVNATLRKNGNYGFACYATGTGGKLSLYRLNDINAYLSSAFAVATLTDDILRLGSSIPESAWNSIAATATITDYGVMIYKTDSEANITSDTPVEDAYRAGVVQPAIARTGHGNAPAAVDGNCVFTARMRVSNNNTIFCAASFMVVGGQYYFFNEQHITAGQLA